MLNSRTLGISVLMVWLSVGTVRGGEPDPPPVFSKLSVPEAKAAAVEQKRLLVVKATASWCGPCKRMDKTTWRDAAVVEWIGANAVAVQFDVDEQVDLKKELRISAMPTMVVFRDGAEFDRSVGFMEAGPLLDWLKGVQQGKKTSDTLRERAAKETPDGVQARLDLAQALVNEGKHDEAADLYVWLWNNMTRISPSMVGVRLSFMKGEMEKLLEAHPGAKSKFAALRDSEECRLDDPKGGGNRGDWIALNEMLGEDDRTLKWFDSVKADRQTRIEAVKETGYSLENVLLRHDRWADYGRLFPAPLQEVQKAVQMRRMLMGLKVEGADEMKEHAVLRFRDSVGKLYAGLLAAGRVEQAKRVLETAEKEDAAPELKVACVEHALSAKKVLPEHAEWLRPIKDSADGADALLEDVEAALKGLPTEAPAEVKDR